MALKTLGARTFAALAFGALTLHGIATVIPPTPDEPPAATFGGGGTFHFIQPDPYQRDEQIVREEMEICLILGILIDEDIV